MKQNRLIHIAVSGVGVALVAGFAEYILTQGTSGWIPLSSGLLGATLGPLIVRVVAGIRAIRRSSDHGEADTRDGRHDERKSNDARLQGRIHCPRTLDELVASVNGRTSIEREGILAKYAGTWLAFSGQVKDVGKHRTEVYALVSSDEQESLTVCSYFDLKWTQHLVVLSVGDHISGVGRIQGIDFDGVILKDCDLAE